MKQVVATALVLLLTLFLLPLLLLGEEPLAGPSQPPAATGTLPIDRTVVTPGQTADGRVQVRVALGDGEVLTLPLDKYLWRVVAAEMPASFEPEALKAQAVTARTYTLYKRSIGANPNHPDADVCADINCCQAYLDPDKAAANWGDSARTYTEKIAQAVSSTDGQAILYDGAPIDAVFFSSAAGRTLSSVEVWGGSVPYLESVESPEGAEVPNYRTTVEVPAEEFKTTLLAQYPQADLSGEASEWFGETVPTSSGGVETMSVGGVTVKGTALRTLFGLRSASFTVEAEGDQVVFSVTGYGHGVGMSQYGANALAKEGKSYLDILTHYYTGVTVAPWSGS